MPSPDENTGRADGETVDASAAAGPSAASADKSPRSIDLMKALTESLRDLESSPGLPGPAPHLDPDIRSTPEAVGQSHSGATSGGAPITPTASGAPRESRHPNENREANTGVDSVRTPPEALTFWQPPDNGDGSQWSAVACYLAGALSELTPGCTGKGTPAEPCSACVANALVNRARPDAAPLPTPCLRVPPRPGLLRWSTLREMLVSPLHCRHLAETGQIDTVARGFGRLVHLAILRPQQFDALVLVEPDFGDLRTKEGRASRAAWYAEIGATVGVKTVDDVLAARASLPEGIEIVSADDRDRALACAEAVRAHPAAAALLEGALTEVELEWERRGVGCGGRLDILRPDGIADLKTTSRTTLRELERDLANYTYHGQLAWYHDGAIRAGRLPRFDAELPHVIAVQSDPPHDVAVLQMDGETYEAGRALADSLLAQWVGCVETGWWPGWTAGEVAVWRLPTWAPGMDVLAEANNGEDW